MSTVLPSMVGISGVKTCAANDPLSFTAMMIKMQMMVVDELNDQYQKLGEKIKFLGKVKEVYQKNISRIQDFISKTPEKNKNNGREILKLTPGQMAELAGCFEEVSYDIETRTITTSPMQIFDSGNAHDLDDIDVHGQPIIKIEDGKVSAQDYANECAEIAKLGHSKAARERAERLGGDNSDRIFYADQAAYAFKDGTPRISVFVDGIQAIQTKIEAQKTRLDGELERLGTDLNALGTKRKAALDALGDCLRKLDEAKSNTVNKMA